MIASALLASAALMALVLALRNSVRRAFGPRVAYALWVLPALRLALPPLPASWSAARAPLSAVGEQVVVLVAPVPPPLPAAWSPDLPALAVTLWAAGAMLFLAWHIVRHHRFRRRLLASAEPLARIGRVQVVRSAVATGPLAFGVLRPVVAVPHDWFERFTPAERRLALAHELAHHARGDLPANWAALVVLAAHWFNPLAFYAFAAFRADQEQATDARVLAARPAAPSTYARALVKAAAGPAFSPVCHLNTLTALKRRLTMLHTPRPTRRRVATGAAVTATLTLGSLALTASGGQAAERVRAVVPVAAPMPPMPPTPPMASMPSMQAEPGQSPASTPAPRKVKRVVVVQGGETRTYEGAEADAYIAAHPIPTPPGVPLAPEPGKGYRILVRHADGSMAEAKLDDAPTVTTRRVKTITRYDKNGKVTTFDASDIPTMVSVQCPNSTSREFVLRDKQNGAERTLICTDRILASADATERTAYTRALAGLRSARAGIAGDSTMSEAQRKNSLSAIDKSTAELEADLAHAQ